jgi:hypothetical protein
MKRILLAVAISGAAGCATEEQAPTYGDGLGTPESPIPNDRSYTVASRINFTSEMPKVQAALVDLRALATNPAHTLLALAQEKNLPALVELNASLSTTLKDRLEGWMNIEIDKVRLGAKTMREYATEMAGVSETALTQFTLRSSLTMSPLGVMHSLTEINFTPVALDIVVPIGGLKADTLTQRTSVMVGEGGVLELGEQEFGLGFGSHAWQAINLASTTLFAGDLHDSLVTAMKCPTIAAAVAAKCYSTSCVGHTAQLQAVCEGATDAIVAKLRERIPAFKLDTYKFVQGTARLVDDNLDGMADRIVDGTWDTEIDFGQGPRAAAATFTASVAPIR